MLSCTRQQSRRTRNPGATSCRSLKMKTSFFSIFQSPHTFSFARFLRSEKRTLLPEWVKAKILLKISSWMLSRLRLLWKFWVDTSEREKWGEENVRKWRKSLWKWCQIQSWEQENSFACARKFEYCETSRRASNSSNERLKSARGMSSQEILKIWISWKCKIVRRCECSAFSAFIVCLLHTISIPLKFLILPNCHQHHINKHPFEKMSEWLFLFLEKNWKFYRNFLSDLAVHSFMLFLCVTMKW